MFPLESRNSVAWRSAICKIDPIDGKKHGDLQKIAIRASQFFANTWFIKNR